VISVKYELILKIIYRPYIHELQFLKTPVSVGPYVTCF
jgi:hypothetical protein